MKIFFSAGEPSGDLHSASLIRELAMQHPETEFIGFGGQHMEQAGCALMYPLAERPVFGFLPVIKQLGHFIELARDARDYFQRHRPDAVVLVDYPGFNWWIARAAHASGIPVYYFLPPQIWAWASWRVHKMRRFVDHVMCSMPFEVEWYKKRNVRAVYTGHPYFDELRDQRIDQSFLEQYRSTPESPVIGILPGSRNSEVERIIPAYVEVAKQIASEIPRARFLIACLKEDHLGPVQEQICSTGLDITTYLGKTPEIIRASRICLSKSGSVSLELMFHKKPSTILYQVGDREEKIFKFSKSLGLVKTPYITLVNLMAESEVFPEYVRCSNVNVLTQHALQWLRSESEYEKKRHELADLNERFAQPGTTNRTARYILDSLEHPARRAA